MFVMVITMPLLIPPLLQRAFMVNNEFSSSLVLTDTVSDNRGNYLTDIPVLCYHRIRVLKTRDGKLMRTYSVAPETFANQMKTLHDSGYQSILPDQVFDHMVHAKPLPLKPVIISFDDTVDEQFFIGKREMDKYGFKGVYFIMTISINRPGYMSSGMIKQLSDEGHAVQNHSWDHHMVTQFSPANWDKQVSQAGKTIEELTARTVNCFAYPNGIWDVHAIAELKKRGYRMAFILSGKKDNIDPVFTIRRMVVTNQMIGNKLIRAIKENF